MVTIVDKKRQQDEKYKSSGVQHFVNDLYKGTDRLNLDSRPVAGSDALFGSYDYFGSNHEVTETNPSVGPYWRMNDLDSLSDFLGKVRKERNQKIDEMNANNPGVYQERFVEKVSHMVDVFISNIKVAQ